jgi:hypothetical protein
MDAALPGRGTGTEDQDRAGIYRVKLAVLNSSVSGTGIAWYPFHSGIIPLLILLSIVN